MGNGEQWETRLYGPRWEKALRCDATLPLGRNLLALGNTHAEILEGHEIQFLDQSIFASCWEGKGIHELGDILSYSPGEMAWVVRHIICGAYG